MDAEFDLPLKDETTNDQFFTDEEMVELQAEIDAGYINVNKHPEYDLYIYNYSKSTQYDWRWNKYTTVCRGLILDANGCLVAKGLNKFFTDDQLRDSGQEHLIPKGEPFIISDKADGSLGILYFWDDTSYISTRGSFGSDMAIEATKWLRDQYAHIVFFPEYSYIFEIIYPENRIVVDYGDDRKLVLLAVIDNGTLKEKNIYDEEFDYIETQGLERAKVFDNSDWESILDTFEGVNNFEGVVVHFTDSDFRVKMKIDWYKTISYLMTYFNKKSVWKLIRDGKDMDAYLDDIYDEYYPTLKGFIDDLWEEYNMELELMHTYHKEHLVVMNEKFPDGYTRKDFVLTLKENIESSFVVGMVISIDDNKSPFRRIWSKIEPTSV